MIEFPTSTIVHRRMPKEAFYKNLSLTKSVKEKFVSDVDKINIENSLTKDNLNLTKDGKIQEIMLLSISLKRQDIDGKVIETIARQNSHELVFLLIYEDMQQLAIYHKKLYRTPWLEAKSLSLKLSGFSLDEIWDSFIEQIALYGDQTTSHDHLSVDERLLLQEQIDKLEKQIKGTESAMWREQQPKKQFELHTQLQKYKKELEELKNGES